MKPLDGAFAILALCIATTILAEPTNIAEDDASHSAYGGFWRSGKNGGSGFGPWMLASERRYSGFFIADTKTNHELSDIGRNDKAFGMYTNGFGFNQLVAYRTFKKALQVGDSFSLLIQHGKFDKNLEKDDPIPGSIGFALRTTDAGDSVADYNKDASFQFGYYQGKTNYQIYDANNNADSGVVPVYSGIAVTVTLKNADAYDFEIETLASGKITKLLNRKLQSPSPIRSMALFNRSSEKGNAFFKQLQVTRESK